MVGTGCALTKKKEWYVKNTEKTQSETLLGASVHPRRSVMEVRSTRGPEAATEEPSVLHEGVPKLSER